MRFATVEDYPAVVEMIRAFLAEQEEQGSPVPLTARNLDVYRSLAWSYLTGLRFGVVVLDDDGFGIAGEDGPGRFETSHGKTATIWLIWVRASGRKSHKAMEMLRFGIPRMLEFGFERVVMSVRDGNEAGRMLTEGFGAKLIERVYEHSLKE